MHKLIVLYPHPKSEQDFRDYYVKNHLPLATQLPGLKASRHSFEVTGVGAPSPYFCIWEGEFDSGQAMGAAMESSIGKQVAADLENYATSGAVVVHFPLP